MVESKSNRDMIDPATPPHPHTTARALACLAIDILTPVKWVIMAATTVDTMLQSNGFQTKKKEDIENKDNLWYVPVARATLTACRDAPRGATVCFCDPREKECESVRNAFRFVWHILLREKNLRVRSHSNPCLTRRYCMLCRSSILAEVQNSGNNKLPSNKNVLVLGK